MTLTYQPTRQRDRYRVFDGRTFLGVVERPRFGPRGWGRFPFWLNSASYEFIDVPEFGRVRRWWSLWSPVWEDYIYTTRTEAAEALRQMRQEEA